MLHIDSPRIRSLLRQGHFGIEKESLRVTGGGRMSHSPHPFDADDPHIVRDFCENQTEINTEVTDSPAAALRALARYDRIIQEKLASLEEPELLWPFSNPPAIANEEDIPVARFTGAQSGKTAYRNYLSDRYGRYKMTFSGIHFNFSFSEELLREDFALSGQRDFRTYKDHLYLELAEKMVTYGWIVTAVTAASPVTDGSFVEKHTCGTDSFLGMASIRCSELGYWNYFTPVLDYSSLEAYTASIRRYVEDRIIRFPSELYYPIRLKPPGANELQRLADLGVSHIELRMIDLNPLTDLWVEEKDLLFAHLLMVWLASIPRIPLNERTQILAAQNFKSAARYDLKTVRTILPDGRSLPTAEAALEVLAAMEDFYQEENGEIREILRFQKDKFLNVENRYAWKVRRLYSDTFAAKGLELAKERQTRILQGDVMP